MSEKAELQPNLSAKVHMHEHLSNNSNAFYFSMMFFKQITTIFLVTATVMKLSQWA
jgi:hypothetical protein